MHITFLGGADEIGASCLLIEVAGVRLLVDAGMRPNHIGQGSLPSLHRITEPPDAIFLTHAHLDHLGALPVVLQRFPHTLVFTSEPTANLAKVMLLDSAYLQTILFDTPLYTEADVLHTVGNFRALLMERWYHLTSNVAFCFVPAGHLLGAVSILLDTAEGRIVISGDVSLTHQRAVPGLAAPHFPADVLILESTYGDNVHPARMVEEQRLAESVTNVVLSGGIALVPSFALGRAQEVILTLRQAQQSQQIPTYPIYVDGLVRHVADVYNSQRRYLAPLLRDRRGHIFWKRNKVIRVEASKRDEILDEPCCIVASSGMLLGGPSVFYASELVSYPANAIFITGYTDEESPGRRLQELAPGEKLLLDGESYEVACQVRKFGLSGHGDAEQLTKVVEHFQPRLTLLVHGHKNGREKLKQRIPNRYQVDLPMNNETFTLLKPFWMIGQRPYLLQDVDKAVVRSQPAEYVLPLIGNVAFEWAEQTPDPLTEAEEEALFEELLLDWSEMEMEYNETANQSTEEVSELINDILPDLHEQESQQQTVAQESTQEAAQKTAEEEEGFLVRTGIPSKFFCLFCGEEKKFTIDLGLRTVYWYCPGCQRTYRDTILNLKVKDLNKLSREQQETLGDLIQVCLYLHEPILAKNWLEFLDEPEKWRHFLTKNRVD